MIPAEFRAAAIAIAVVALVAIGVAGGWIASAWKHDAEIAELRRAHTEYRATLTEAALADVQADAAVIRQAATEFAGIQSTLAPKMTALTKELRNAKPLPAGCRPDADRVRNLDAAIDAANQSIPR